MIVNGKLHFLWTFIDWEVDSIIYTHPLQSKHPQLGLYMWPLLLKKSCNETQVCAKSKALFTTVTCYFTVRPHGLQYEYCIFFI